MYMWAGLANCAYSSTCPVYKLHMPNLQIVQIVHAYHKLYRYVHKLYMIYITMYSCEQPKLHMLTQDICGTTCCTL